MKWTKADGTQNPDWWETEGKRDTDSNDRVESAGEDVQDDWEIVSLYHMYGTVDDR
jgi:hypothetical protein